MYEITSFALKLRGKDLVSYLDHNSADVEALRKEISKKSGLDVKKVSVAGSPTFQKFTTISVNVHYFDSQRDLLERSIQEALHPWPARKITTSMGRTYVRGSHWANVYVYPIEEDEANLIYNKEMFHE